VVWWAIVLTVPTMRSLFFPSRLPDLTMYALLFADLPLYAGASLLAGIGVFRRADWAKGLVLVHLGASLYATLYSLGFAVMTGDGWLSLALMAPSSLITASIARSLR
jgi:hypothetical protein